MNKFNILFIKTPKCASESISEHLKDYAEDAGLSLNIEPYKRFFDQHSFNINTNHVYFDKETYNHFNKSKNPNYSSLVISCFRKPIERLISSFYYNKTSDLDFSSWYKYSHYSGTLDVYNKRNLLNNDSVVDNIMSKYMGISCLDDLVIYDLILLKENFSVGLQKLEDILDYKFKNNYFRNKGSYKNIEVDREAEEIFNYRNSLDNLIYERLKIAHEENSFSF